MKLQYFSTIVVITIIFSLAISPSSTQAQSLNADYYSIGFPTLTEYFVDPTNGNDRNNGTSRSTPKKTVTSIWSELPENRSLSSGVRINLLPGTYGSNHLPNYWENRIGTATKPIILSSLDGFGTVNFTRDINMAGDR
jgi:hypothetical protein